VASRVASFVELARFSSQASCIVLRAIAQSLARTLTYQTTQRCDAADQDAHVDVYSTDATVGALGLAIPQHARTHGVLGSLGWLGGRYPDVTVWDVTRTRGRGTPGSSIGWQHSLGSSTTYARARARDCTRMDRVARALSHVLVRS